MTASKVALVVLCVKRCMYERTDGIPKALF